jgi:hypothetical protein
MRLARLLAIGQGAYYAATGVWPFVSLPTFLAVTGPKTDVWLVHTVGALVIAMAIALLVGARRDGPSSETIALGAGAALAFAAIEAWYGLRGVISPVYLADAAVELAIALAWAGVALTARARGRTPSR